MATMKAPFPSPTSVWHIETYPALSPTRPELSAKGKTVLVTGGGSGIGAEVARYFAMAGASRIAILGRREQPLLDTKASIEKQSPDVEVFIASADITNREGIDSAFKKFLGDAKLDVLVSNAAVAGPMGRIGEANTDEIYAGIETNVIGSLNVAQAFLRHAAEDAVVIETSSTAAHVDFAGAFASYSIAKMAVIRLWDSVASAHPKLSIFHTQPGVVDTEMNRAAGGVAALGFEDKANLPGSFYVWLASPEARFLKGKFLYTNWDVDELKSRAKEIEASPQFSIGLVGWPFSSEHYDPGKPW